MRRVRLPVVLVAALVSPVACSDPLYDDDLGIEAIPVEDGELAGTFGYKSVSALILTVEVPGLEDSYAGSSPPTPTRRRSRLTTSASTTWMTTGTPATR